MTGFCIKNDLDSLIMSVANGSSDAMAELYRQTSPGIYAYTLSILKNHHDAEDVLQECYLRIQQSASQYRPQGKPMAWIFTITRNICLKHLQSRQREVPLLFDSGANWDVDDKLVIEACLQHLSDEDRQIVLLHAVAGMKHRQIGEFLGLPLSTVLSKYHRSIKKMRSIL